MLLSIVKILSFYMIIFHIFLHISNILNHFMNSHKRRSRLRQVPNVSLGYEIVRFMCDNYQQKYYNKIILIIHSFRRGILVHLYSTYTSKWFVKLACDAERLPRAKSNKKWSTEYLIILHISWRKKFKLIQIFLKIEIRF